MHFVGNYSIIMGNGTGPEQLHYNNLFTGLSAVIPVVTLLAAFWVAQRRHHGGRLRWIATLITVGILGGCAICGMHYTGNIGISNYSFEAMDGYVICAVLIACLACVFAMMAMFEMQDRFLTGWSPRMFCAILLSLAAFGMHFTASKGTTFRLKEDRASGTASRKVYLYAGLVVVSFSTPQSHAPYADALKRPPVVSHPRLCYSYGIHTAASSSPTVHKKSSLRKCSSTLTVAFW